MLFRSEGELNAVVRPMVDADEAVAASCTIKRDENIVSTQNMTITVRVQPFGYPRTIALDMGFTAIGA